MKHRIALYTLTHFAWGGSFQYAKAVAEALGLLDRQTYEVKIWHSGGEEWKNLAKRLGFVDHVISEYDIPPEFASAVKKILEALEKTNDAAQRQQLIDTLNPFSALTLLHQWGPHLVFCPQMGGQYYVPGARQVGVIHDLMHRYEPRFPEVGTPQEQSEREKLFCTMIEKCDAILVDSKVGMQQVLESYRRARAEQLRVVPFAAFGELIHCEPKQPDFSVPEKYLFYPAQFWLHKNHVGLALAVADAIESQPDLRIVVAGNLDQNGYADFAHIVREKKLEHAFLTPGYVSVEELSWFYTHARACIMPTFFGPTNIPPLEAMALNCPVAVSDIYGMREQCGEAALYFNPASSKSLSQAIRQLWTDDALCAELVRKGQDRSHIRSEHAFSKNIIRLVEGLCN